MKKTGLIAKISIKYVLPTCIWTYFWRISRYFAFFWELREISRKYLNFAGPRPRELSEALRLVAHPFYSHENTSTKPTSTNTKFRFCYKPCCYKCKSTELTPQKLHCISPTYISGGVRKYFCIELRCDYSC